MKNEWTKWYRSRNVDVYVSVHGSSLSWPIVGFSPTLWSRYWWRYPRVWSLFLKSHPNSLLLSWKANTIGIWHQYLGQKAKWLQTCHEHNIINILATAGTYSEQREEPFMFILICSIIERNDQISSQHFFFCF